MDFESRYRVNEPGVVSETIDGEVIIIHMETGAYYTTKGTGAFIWQFIESGASVRQIAEQVTGAYAGDPMGITFSIAPFITQLIDQKLITPLGARTAPPELDTTPRANKAPFVAPNLEVYRDMQNLLMIDPIHEVDDDLGWPTLNADR